VRSLRDLGVLLVDRGHVPDVLTRAGIRHLCRRRLTSLPVSADDALEVEGMLATAMARSPIALVPEKANEQHYEVPASFFEVVLGPRRKYSSCHFPTPDASLADAESSSLAITAERARLADGQAILELGCGWGSLTLWMAERFPESRITAVSNSGSQRRSIEAICAERGLRNVTVITADANTLELDGRFDRVVSIEMFEHLRNWPRMLERIAGWLEPEGLLFLHVFCHHRAPYLFEDLGATDWMSRHFFSGGLMPSRGLIRRFDRDLHVVGDWYWEGTHYERTANAWLANLDRRRDEATAALATAMPAGEAERWTTRWRIFFMACAELFGLRDGAEWGVAHHLLARS